MKICMSIVVISLLSLLLIGCNKVVENNNNNSENIEAEDFIVIDNESTEHSEKIESSEVKTEVSISDLDVIELPEFSPQKDTIGNLWIPTCNIVANIRYGSTMEAVANKNIGEFECSDPIGKGNYSILGHSNEIKDYILSTLEPNIQIGDSVYVIKDNILFTFEVYETMIVESTDTWILKSTKEPIITIMCCTNNGEQRFVVRGILKTETVI